MKRYDSWHHTRYVGDRALALRYLPEGRKWLGFVREQLELSGNESGIVHRSSPGGPSFTAQIIGGIPILTIDVRNVSQEDTRSLYGFVVSPSPTADHSTGLAVWPDIGDFPEVLLDGPRGALGYSRYKVPFTAGLRQCGNIDWRNADESLIVSFYGPRLRYFDRTNAIFRPWVLRNGFTVIDVESDAFMAQEAAAGMEFGLITGACIRGDALLFVVRNGLFGDTEALFSAALNGNPRTKAAVGVEYASLARLAQRTMLTDEGTTDGTHPWMFNQKGTAARCIRGYYDEATNATIYAEVALDCADLDSAAFSYELLGPGIVSTTTVDQGAGSNDTTPTTTWTGQFGVDPDTGDPEYLTVAIDPGPPETAYFPGADFIVRKPTAFGVNGSYRADLRTTTVTADVGEFKIAVDFRNDQVVYAYLTPATSVSIDSSGDTAVAYAQATGTLDTSASGSSSSSFSGVGVGLKTDFVTIAPTQSGSSSTTFSGRVVLTGNNRLGGADSTRVVRNDDSTSSTVSTTLALLYLDLRAKWLVYESVEVSSTSHHVLSYDETRTGDISVNVLPDMVGTDTVTSEPTRIRTVVQKGADVLAEDVLTLGGGSSGPTDATPIPARRFGSYDVGGGVIEGDGARMAFWWLPENINPILVPVFNTYTGLGDVSDGTASHSTDSTDAALPLQTLLPYGYAETDNNNFRHPKRTDRNGFVRYGSWQHYKTKWAFSMGLIVESVASAGDTSIAKTLPDRWLSGSNVGDLEALSLKASQRWNGATQDGLVGAPLDLFFPIFVVPNTSAA